MRTQTIRAEVQRLIQQVPFRPFVLSMENGDRVTIEHPENIAFEPDHNGQGGSVEFYVLSKQLRLFAPFETVTSVALADEGN